MIENEYKLEGCTPFCKLLAGMIDSKFGNCELLSGKRNEESNRVAGGSKQSMHLLGRALDIRVKNVHVIKVAAFLMYNIFKIKWTRLAINLRGNYIHIDDKEVPEIPVVRFYNRQNKWEF